MTEFQDLKDSIRTVPDYPVEGVQFRDITTLLQNASLFKKMIDGMTKQWEKTPIDAILSIESRGFIFASTVSYALKKPFILLRKKNKLPAETHSVDFKLEYGEATIEVHKDSIQRLQCLA